MNLKHTLIALAASLPMAAGLITLATPADAAAPVSAAVAITAGDPSMAAKNAYIRYVAGVTEVSYTLRVRLLKYGYRACEGIVAHVPSVQIVTVLKRDYHLTSAEAWRVYYGANKFFC